MPSNDAELFCIGNASRESTTMKSRLTFASLAAAAALFALPSTSQAGFVHDGDDCLGWLRTHADDMMRRVDDGMRRVDDSMRHMDDCLTVFHHREAAVVKGHHHAKKGKKARKMAAMPKK
jgi:hypothetical protein